MSSSTNSLAECLEESLDLRPFPAAASQLISACDRPDSTAKELSEIIKHDPALSLKLLQVANSPMYGFSGEIRSVDHAAVVLGMRALKDLAVSTAVSAAFGSGGADSAVARQSLWLHSLACGAIARTLAAKVGLGSPDEAFLGGIVHDVGKLFFFDHRPDQYIKVTSAAAGQNTVSLENEAFGIAHTFVGQKCGQNWGLPEEINDVICFHHSPADADFGGDLIEVVSAANQLCHCWMNSTAESEATTLQIINEAGFSLTETEISELNDQAMTEVNSINKAYA